MRLVLGNRLVCEVFAVSGLTPAQERAVRALTGDISISAGAGSGKTRVLAHRFAQALSESGIDGIDMDAILTITFTTKAAGEIAERVRRVLAEQERHALARRVDEAWISTIHGMCSRLVRRHALEAGVSPYFRTADEVMAGLLRSEAWERASQRLFESDQAVLGLFEVIGHVTVRNAILSAHGRLRAMGSKPQDLRVILGSLSTEMGSVSRELEDLVGCIEAAPPTASRAAAAATLRALTTRILAGDEQAAAELAFSPAKLWRNEPRCAIDGAGAEAAIARLRACVSETKYDWIAYAFVELLAAFDAEYSVLKLRREVLDFDDLQEQAAIVLEDDAVARSYRKRFRLIMVDEFQDTNQSQMRVIERLRDDNLCVVGDDKQSIYGWRYADVEVFRRLRSHIATSERLDTNFRSHPHVLGFTNELFSRQPFWPDYMRLEAGRTEPSVTRWPEGEPRVEVMLVQKGEAPAAKAAGIEAEAVAARVASLHDDGIELADIVILLRGATYADEFAAALSRRGLDVLQNAGGRFFDASEIEDMRALLRAVVLPRDDEAFARVLSGDLGGLSTDGLWRVRKAASRTGSLWDGACALVAGGGAGLGGLDAQLLVAAHTHIEELRARAGRQSLSELIRAGVRLFDHDLVLLAKGSAGRTAWANVLKLIRIAASYEQIETPDPLAFERYLELREQYTSRESQGVTSTSADGAVRIMTIHAAKGLEFPVVIVADLGRKVTSAPDDRFLVGGVTDDGMVPLGFKMPDASGRLKQDSLERSRLCEQYTSEGLAEEKRVFYVACTRAGDALILSGTTGATDSRLSWVTDNLRPGEQAGTASIGPVTVRVREFEAPPADQQESRSVVRPGGLRGSSVEPGLAARVDAAREILERHADVGDADATRATRLPATISYSSLRDYHSCKRRFYVRYVVGLHTERFGSDSAAVRFGSAVHATLHRVADGGLSEPILEAVARAYALSAEERQRLSAAARAYLDSPVARELAQADRVHREQPFALDFEGIRLQGTIDAIAWNGNEALILDYKSGTSALSGSAEEAYRSQAEFYALAAIAAGAARVRAVFARIERHDEVYEFVFEASDKTRLEESVAAAIAGMASGDYEPLEAYDHEVCSECPALYGLCEVRPQRGASRS